MSDGDTLQPGEIIKPSITKEEAGSLLTSLYGLTPASVTEFNSYDDRNFYFSVQETGDNIWSPGYILKVTNSRDSRNLVFSEAQNEMILHMARHGLEVPEPVVNKHGELQSLETLVSESGTTQNIVRLLRFIPGNTLYDIDPWTTKHFHQCGEFAAKMDAALESFQHPG